MVSTDDLLRSQARADATGDDVLQVLVADGHVGRVDALQALAALRDVEFFDPAVGFLPIPKPLGDSKRMLRLPRERCRCG